MVLAGFCSSVLLLLSGEGWGFGAIVVIFILRICLDVYGALLEYHEVEALAHVHSSPRH